MTAPCWNCNGSGKEQGLQVNFTIDYRWQEKRIRKQLRERGIAKIDGDILDHATMNLEPIMVDCHICKGRKIKA